MKKKIRFICTVALAIAAISTPVLAATPEENGAVPYSAIRASSTMKDSDGNKYSMYGSCTCAGKSASATTEFKITLYIDGRTTANGYSKKLSARCATTFGNGASNSGTSRSATRTGGSGSFTSTESGFVYNVKTSTGTHALSCNGGSCSGTSFTS